jgi:hypothetical protein
MSDRFSIMTYCLETAISGEKLTICNRNIGLLEPILKPRSVGDLREGFALPKALSPVLG